MLPIRVLNVWSKHKVSGHSSLHKSNYYPGMKISAVDIRVDVPTSELVVNIVTTIGL